MPAAFNNCVKKGGRVRTISGPNKKFGLSSGQYRKICYVNGKAYLGHVKTKKKE